MFFRPAYHFNMSTKVAHPPQELSVAERAARAMQKNRAKKRTLKNATDAPPAKKQARASGHPRSIAFKPDHLKVVTKNLGCTSFFCPLTGKHALYSSLTSEPLYFYAYPIVLGAPESKGNQNKSAGQLCGVSKQELVFSVLRKSFAEIFPDLEPQQIDDWDLWKWNKAFYGQSVVKRAQPWTELENKHVQHRFLGGDKCPAHVNLFNEVKSVKASKTVDMAEIFADTPGAQCFDRKFIFDLRKNAEELAKKKNFIVPIGQLEEWLGDREELSDDSDAEEQSEDDEYEE